MNESYTHQQLRDAQTEAYGRGYESGRTESVFFFMTREQLIEAALISYGITPNKNQGAS